MFFLSMIAFMGFITISILSYVFSAKYNRNPTLKVNGVLRKFRCISVIGVIFSGIMVLAAIFIGASGAVINNIKEDNIVLAVLLTFLLVIGILSVIPLVMSAIALAKLNNSLAVEPAAVRLPYCANCHAERMAGSNFCIKCGSQNYYYK